MRALHQLLRDGPHVSPPSKQTQQVLLPDRLGRFAVDLQNHGSHPKPTIRSKLMNDTIFNLAIPYTVEFIRYRCRKIEGLVVWEEGPVAIRTATDEEARVAYQIRNAAGSSGREYDVRSFNGKLWWPAFAGQHALTADALISSASDPNGYLLAMMNLSPATLYSPREITTERFDRDATVRRILSSSKRERWLTAHRAASRVLFCGNAVYLEGGPPAYFGRSYDRLNPMTLSMEVGRLHPQGNQLFDRWLPGSIANRRLQAARRSLVFRADEMEEGRPALERNGYRLLFEMTVIACSDIVDGPDSSEVCADSLVRALLDSERAVTPRILGEANMPHRLPINPANELISRQSCREIIHEKLAAHSPESFEKQFGLEFEWARRAVSRLDERFPEATLTPEDEELLMQL